MSGTFTYSNPRIIHWGAGSVERLGEELTRLDAGRILLLTTRSIAGDQALQGAVRAAMAQAVIAASAVVGQHAPLGEIEAAVETAAAARVDGVVSFGGGSVIDAAKIVSVKLADRDGREGRALPHIAIPTTLSVAELAAGAGFTNEAGDKAGMRDPRLMPECVIYDAELTLATPIRLWLSTGIRALDHAVEAFLAAGEHPFSDVMALESIRRLMASLPRTKVSPGDASLRVENQLAAWFSFTLPGESASGLSHVMGKQIGARHGIPHGVTSCLLMPHVMRYLARARPDRMAALAEVTGDDPPARVEHLIALLGLPQHIADFHVGEADLTRAASELAGKYPAADLLRIYLAAL
ncbi:MAG: iron-containing alcohol dehydrogenase [Candidatus Dormibacterales bacterium]